MAPEPRDSEDTASSPLSQSPTALTTSNADTPHPSAPVQHRVSFHSSSYDSSPRSTGNRMASVAQDAESSGDETTAIVKKQKGGKRNYSTQSQADRNGTAVRRPGSDISPKGTRQSALEPDQHYDGTEQHPQQDQEEINGDEVTKSWWKSLLDKYGSIELENKGSVARDHLALERTFLAWLRTSLAFASIGIAVTQLFRLNTALTKDPTEGELKLRHVGKPLGGTFLAIGILTLILGFHRYFESQHYVILGKFPASRGSVVCLTFFAAALIISSFVVLLTVAPSAIDSN